jgi:hypothetical protein
VLSFFKKVFKFHAGRLINSPLPYLDKIAEGADQA